MNDIEYCLKQDNKERKEIGRSARHKVKNSKGRCRLPSDNMSQAQWKKKNGECITVNLNKLISYKDFKRLSQSMQKEYLQKLIDKYSPTQKDIAIAMGASASTFNAYVTKNIPELTFTRRKTGSPIEWDKFVNGEEEKIVEEDVVVEEEKNEIDEANNEMKEVYDNTFATASQGILSLTGDPYAVFARVLKLFDANQHYAITIQFKKMEEEYSC